MNKIPALLIGLVFTFLTSCSGTESKQELPYFGKRTLQERQEGGKTVVDTIYHQVADFSFVNQDSTIITQKDVEGKVYVSDYFFTSCPTICPKMKSQLLRVYEKYKDHPDFRILSHSIDVDFDTVAVLRDYAQKLEVSSKTWHFLTGKEEDIIKMAHQYLLAAQRDSTAEGGYDHSGKFILVDRDRHIRATCNGTDPKEVDEFMKKIELLLGNTKS